MSEFNGIITNLKYYIMDLSVYQKAEFLKSRGYSVGIAKGTENYPHHVTKPGTQLDCSVNYAYNLETKQQY